MGSLAVKLLPGQLCEALGAKGSTIVFALLSFVVWGINSLWLLSSHVGGFYWLSEGVGNLKSLSGVQRVDVYLVGTTTKNSASGEIKMS